MELLRVARTGLLALLVALAGLGMAPVQAQGPSEYTLKAVFLYNFCRFIEWPSSAFASPDEPFTIGIVGDDPFGSLLSEAIAGETYHGRRIRIEHYRGARDIKRCHLLFVARSAAGQTADILAAVAGKSVVTVGENDAFIENGGMIALTADQNRVRLRINPAAVRAANVAVSSKLLRVAETKS